MHNVYLVSVDAVMYNKKDCISLPSPSDLDIHERQDDFARILGTRVTWLAEGVDGFWVTQALF